jgi:kynurenine formamidase
VDLTHTLSPRFPFIPVQNKTFPFRIAPIADLHADGVAANRWELTEHVGTHVDAPNHFAEGGASLDRIPLRDLLVPAVVIDLRPEVERSPDAVLDLGAIASWEARHGRIPAGAGVFLLSGCARRAEDAPAFVNMDRAGTMHFPGFAPEAITFLVRERDVRGIGTDTLSIDPGVDRKYLGHHLLFAAGRWAAECVANLEQIPAKGATVFLAAPKVQGATGGPARIVAFW